MPELTQRERRTLEKAAEGDDDAAAVVRAFLDSGGADQ